MKRLKVLISAYACRPGEGSEPGVGWNVMRELVKHHDIWVITREENRPSIEQEINQNPIPGLQFVYCEPSGLIRKINYKQILVHLHYYLWQVKAYFIAKKVHEQVGFDIAHHVTYVRYSSPSFISFLPFPFIWGPVGGGESAPASFWPDFSLRGKIYEFVRQFAHRLGELDPFTRLTAQRSTLVRATTEETEKRLYLMGAQAVQVTVESGLSEVEIEHLGQFPLTSDTPLRLISMARLLHWKGLHLGIRAFAQANLPHAEYWILGDGPERQRLQTLAAELNVADKVKFWGRLPRHETLQKLEQSQVLLHPSLHDSGGWVCLEAMAAGRPIICLNLGGPAIQVNDETGFKIAAHTPDRSVQDMAIAIKTLDENPELRVCMGQAGRERVKQHYSWMARGAELADLYRQFVQDSCHNE